MDDNESSEGTKRRLRDFRLGVARKISEPTAPLLGVESILAAQQKGEPGHVLSHWLADRFNKNFDAYDRAIDSVYNDSHIGGSQFHHILDGQHDFWGAFKSAAEIGDQSWLSDMGHALEHLFRDAMSVSGINPFFSLSPDQFHTVADLAKHFGITPVFLADALTVNGPELLGGSIAMVTTLLMGSKASPERLSRFSGGCLLSAAVSANPFLMPVAAAGMVYAVRQSEDRKAVFLQAGKGALVSGSALLVASLVGGPAWLGCAAALMTGVAISNAIDNPQRAFERASAIVAPAARVFQDAATRLRTFTSESLLWKPGT